MSHLSQLTPGKRCPDVFNVIIEIAADRQPVKYEVDKETGLLMVDRFLTPAMFYPCNYGYIPGTLADDGDPMDVLILSPCPIQPGALIEARAIGVLMMSDEAGEDSKILALPTEKACPEYKGLQSLSDVPEAVIQRITHFFEHYKDLEPGKWVKVTGWEDQQTAHRLINDSLIKK